MSKNYILAIDQGTTGTTALIVDETFKLLSKENIEFDQHFPKPGWVEHHAKDIWQSVEKAVAACLKKANLDPNKIQAIGLTNQRETTCLFDKKGNSPHPFIVWQCKRTTEICQNLHKQNHEDFVRNKTGLLLDPYFSGTKLTWLFNNFTELKEKASQGKLMFGTIDSWLLYRLTGNQKHKTDATNASRTLLMDLKGLNWDEDLLKLFEVPKSCLPQIVSNSEVYGHTKGLSFLPDGIPIAGMAGDQQAALFGQGCFKPGQAKASYGTGCFVLMNTGESPVISTHGLLTSVALNLNKQTTYCLEGSAFIAGAAVQWLRDKLGLIKSSAEIEVLASQTNSSEDVVFVPAFSGLGAPHWEPNARAMLCGLSRDSDKFQIARAVLEGIALQNYDMVKAMEKESNKLDVLKVDGGASRNNLLMQFQADILQTPCVRPKILESTAAGAAALAGLAVGIYPDLKFFTKHLEVDKTFSVNMSKAKLKHHLDKWHNAIKRVRIR